MNMVTNNLFSLFSFVNIFFTYLPVYFLLLSYPNLESSYNFHTTSKDGANISWETECNIHCRQTRIQRKQFETTTQKLWSLILMSYSKANEYNNLLKNLYHDNELHFKLCSFKTMLEVCNRFLSSVIKQHNITTRAEKVYDRLPIESQL